MVSCICRCKKNSFAIFTSIAQGDNRFSPRLFKLPESLYDSDLSVLTLSHNTRTQNRQLVKINPSTHNLTCKYTHKVDLEEVNQWLEIDLIIVSVRQPKNKEAVKNANFASTRNRI